MRHLLQRRSGLRLAARPALIAVLVLAFASAGGASGGFGPVADYLGSHTIVVKGLPSPTLDRGGVICRSDGPSIGGACIPFSPLGDSILVTDDKAGLNVAFQVCIDNNGDRQCGGTASNDPCGDEIFFSHDDFENFFNPLGRLPTGFRSGCSPAAAFPGYVVFICQGIHSVQGQPPHTHIATKGTIALTTGGSGLVDGHSLGTFCGGGGTVQTPPKPYEVR